MFAAFCAAGLWPGLGRRLADALPDAEIDGPDSVTSEALTRLPKVGRQRAGRLLSAWIAAQPSYEVATIVVPAGLDARVAGRLVDLLGPPAPRLLRDDPWRLLGVTGVSPADADRVARATIPGVRRDDVRRSRALVGWVLARIARDGHTQTPREDVAAPLAEFGVGDPQDAIAAALDAGLVHESPRRAARTGPLRRGRGRDRTRRRTAPRRRRADRGAAAADRQPRRPSARRPSRPRCAAASPSSPAAPAPARAAPSRRS